MLGVSTASDVGMPVWDNRNVSPLPELIVDLHVHTFFQDSTHQTLNFLTDPDTNYTIIKQMLEDNYTGLMAALWDEDLVELDLSDEIGSTKTIYVTTMPRRTDSTEFADIFTQVLDAEAVAILGSDNFEPLQCAWPEVVTFHNEVKGKSTKEEFNLAVFDPKAAIDNGAPRGHVKEYASHRVRFTLEDWVRPEICGKPSIDAIELNSNSTISRIWEYCSRDRCNIQIEHRDGHMFMQSDGILARDVINYGGGNLRVTGRGLGGMPKRDADTAGLDESSLDDTSSDGSPRFRTLSNPSTQGPS